MKEETNQKFGGWYPVKLDYALLKDRLDSETISQIYRYTVAADRLRQRIHRLIHIKK